MTKVFSPSQQGSRVTLTEVARAAGVSLFTASRSLTGGEGVSEQTRKRLLEVAQKLGYRVDLLASLLARKRKAKDAAKANLSIVVIDGRSELRSSLSKEVVGQGIRLEWFSREAAYEPGFARMLKARGIDGIILSTAGSWWMEREVPPRLGDFPVVKLSRGLPGLNVPLVRHSAFDYMWRTLQGVYSHGYRRLSVLLFRTPSQVDDAARIGAVRAFGEMHPNVDVRMRFEAITHLDFVRSKASLRWFAQQRGRCLVCNLWALIGHMMMDGVLDPKNNPSAATLIADDLERSWPGLKVTIAGCPIQRDEQARRALALLLELIARGERGGMATPIESVIEPVWRDGDSLPRGAGEQVSAR